MLSALGHNFNALGKVASSDDLPLLGYVALGLVHSRALRIAVANVNANANESESVHDTVDASARKGHTVAKA